MYGVVVVRGDRVPFCGCELRVANRACATSHSSDIATIHVLGGYALDLQDDIVTELLRAPIALHVVAMPEL
jgi:hypothetical protein